MAILTVEELRKHVAFPTGADADDALQRLLDAAEEAIVEQAGVAGAITELLDGVGRWLIASRPIASVTTVTEDWDGTPLEIEADDFRHLAGGYVLERLSTGTNASYAWSGKVSVVYVPVADTATRELVQIELVRIFLNHHPGLTAQAIGEWSETFADSAEYGAEYAAILARLAPPPSMAIIG